MYSRIYVHVPFCVEKCRYCSFVSAPPQNNDLLEYPKLLLQELQLHPPAATPVDSIYCGGGTPTLLSPSPLSQLLEAISSHSGISSKAEITLEANPGTVDFSSLTSFRESGFNRISLGVQSFDNNVLQRLGRIHSASQSVKAFQGARKAGFDNISIDLMHSLPGQTIDQWRSQLEQARSLAPEHISIYGLTVEEGTPFARIYPADSPVLPDEDLSADMFELANEFLCEAGYEHYEIASYARPGYRSQHNCGYWKRDGYLGLGVGAHSFLRKGSGIRFFNPASLPEYRQMVATGQLARIDEHILAESDALSEYLFLGLRISDGVDLNEFELEFGRSLASLFGSATDDLCRLGLLVLQGERFALTQKGMLLSNRVFARFV